MRRSRRADAFGATFGHRHVRSAVCGGVGRDAFGESMRAALASEGVDASLIAVLPERTGLTFVRRDERGEPSFLFYRRRTADVSVRPIDVPPSFKRASWLLVGTSTWMTPGLRNTTRTCLRRARSEGASIVVDLNVRAHMWPDHVVMRARIGALAGRADLIKASDADLAALSADGRTVDLAWLAAHAPQATWLITRGGGNATAVGPHGEVSAPAHTRDVIDATGAGDAFLAGVLAVLVAADARPGRAAWQDAAVFAEALAVGHRMGERAVSAVGAVAGLIDLEPVRARIKQMVKASNGEKVR